MATPASDPPLPPLWAIYLCMAGCSFAAAIGQLVWWAEIPVYWIRHRTLKGYKDHDDVNDACGLRHVEPVEHTNTEEDMRQQYARVLSLILSRWPAPESDKLNSGSLFHNMKGCWCVWVGLSRERSGKGYALSLWLNVGLIGWLAWPF